MLIDIGLGPRQLAERLARARRSWQDVDAVLLTHTHGDHWNERTLGHLARRQIPVWCHAHHRRALHGEAFAKLQAARQVHHYEAGETLELAPCLSCQPVRLSHDEPTFGFRFEGRADFFGSSVLGYATDLGSWSPSWRGRWRTPMCWPWNSITMWRWS